MLIAFEIICLKKTILLSEYNSTHLNQEKNLVFPSLHFKVSTVTKELKTVFSL